jgi:hypothetical protein
MHVNRLFAHYGDDPDLLRKLIADVRRERAEAGRASMAGGV